MSKELTVPTVLRVRSGSPLHLLEAAIRKRDGLAQALAAASEDLDGACVQVGEIGDLTVSLGGHTRSAPCLCFHQKNAKRANVQVPMENVPGLIGILLSAFGPPVDDGDAKP